MSSVSTIPAVLPARDRTHTARQLVIIDSSVSELPSLIADVRSHSDVLVLDSARDGIAQISEFLSSVSSISSLHLVSHGTSGNLFLGKSQLNINSLDRYLPHLKSWRTTLDGADLILYGCQVAAHGMGELFIQQLHRLTGANIAASTELVGNTPQGSNWTLDVHAGQVTSPVVFSEQLQQSYSGHFINISVSQNTDTLIETEGTAYTLTFELDEAPDQTVGTTFLLRTSVPNALGEFNVVGGGVTGLSGAPIIANATDILVNVDGQVGGSLPPDGPPFFASITVPIINDATPEGPEDITWEILPVPPELEGSAPGVTEGVTINPAASDVTVTIFDDPSQVSTNDPPTITSAAAASVAENQTDAIDVESTDDNDSEGSGLTYSITGGADASAFSIDADTGVVTFNDAPDFEAPGDANGDNDFEIQVTVTDSGGESTAQDITVSVTDVAENAAPTITSADAVSVEENQTAAIDVESSDDNDSEGSGLTYSITGGADASAFSIDANSGVVSFNDAPDFEAPGDANGDNDFELQVTVSDADGLTDSQDITVSVSDVVENAAPTITSPAAVSVEENQTAAIDVDSTDDISSEGDGLTYAISGGADASAFSIDADTGVVSFNDAPDFEAPADANGDNDFELQVTVSDADGLTDSQD
ncbi:MAG: DUF4347 domain-containing protein, partial [Cyanobacteria bacterium P01_E01_bin.45]